MALGLNVTLRTSRSTAIATRAGTSAILTIYDGVRPALGGTVTNQLSQHTCNASAFGNASSGVLTLNSIASNTSAGPSSGIATWFRVIQSVANGSGHVFDGSVTSVATGTGDMLLDNTNIISGGTVAISSGTITEGNAT